MDRMKTFLKYVILLVGFFALSIFLENGLLLSMYSKIPGEIDTYYSATNSKFQIENVSAKACNINGYIGFDLINSTGNYVDKCFMKMELYNERGLLADTEYIEVSELQKEQRKTYNIKFKANNIEKFKVSVVENTPDKTNIIDVLGWEIDLTNIFGLGIDLSNITVFGRNITEILNWQNIKYTGIRFWNWFVTFAKGIPVWAYCVAWLFYAGLL